ncbi:MAG TPA: TadE/TadG family type IV pilus assembly protein [Devosia sp.]|nr:TadE/TadG family type IV pilus assembly protein [Devosia sp.]
MTFRQRILRGMFAPAIARARRFGSDDRGVTAIEFGVLAIPFFVMVYAIMETAMLFFASQVLDSAVEDASRRVRTGQAQAASWNLTNFRTELCGYTFNLFGDCSGIQIKVAVIANFAAAATAPAVQTCTSSTCTWDPDFQSYNGGTRRDVVQVQAFYRWPLQVILPYFNLRNQPDNYRLISAMRVFRNEPF